MNKKNLTLLLVLLSLVAVSAVYQYLWLPRVADSLRQENWLAKINFSEVDKIVIERNGVATTLDKIGERWRVASEGEWFVNEILTDNFTKAWQNVASSSMFVVSTSKDTKADFKTDGSFTLKLLAKNKIISDLAIGSNRAGYTYVSPTGSDTSYEVGADLRSPFDYEEWRDFNIFNTGSDKFSQIKITQGKNSLVLKKVDGVWQSEGKDKIKLNQDKVGRMVALMGELSANSIPDQKFSPTGLEKNNWTVEATGEGLKNTLIIGQEAMVDKKPSGNLFVKNALSPNIYLVGKSILGVFQANPKDLAVSD